MCSRLLQGVRVTSVKRRENRESVPASRNFQGKDTLRVSTRTRLAIFQNRRDVNATERLPGAIRHDTMNGVNRRERQLQAFIVGNSNWSRGQLFRENGSRLLWVQLVRLRMASYDLSGAIPNRDREPTTLVGTGGEQVLPVEELRGDMGAGDAIALKVHYHPVNSLRFTHYDLEI